MRNWLIRKLGGIPPFSVEWQFGLILDGKLSAFTCKGEMISFLGGVPLPKAAEGQYLRRPSACRKPVRKARAGTAPVIDGTNSNATTNPDMKILSVNLCDNCNARATDCHSATKETDGNNTLVCDQWKL